MSVKSQITSFGVVVGAALTTSILATSTVNAGENPFRISEITSSYLVADSHMEGKCGSKMEGKCGMKMMMKKMDSDQDGAISKEEFMEHHEMKFNKMDKNEDGKVTKDEMKMMMEKMHEGKCGGMKSDS